MCGIAGIFGSEDAAPVLGMLGALAHRGPDGGGLAVVGRAALGHRRLAIHDLTAAGAQPFVARAGGVAAVVNGEFYDWERIRAGLEARGHAFRGRSDSEIVLPLWLVVAAVVALLGVPVLIRRWRHRAEGRWHPSS